MIDPRPTTLADLLPSAAVQWPRAVGLIDAERSWSFADLDAEVGALARRLAAAGVGPGDHVVVATTKSSWSFRLVHAVLRLGAVVVPIDPFAGGARVGALLETVEPACVVVDAASVVRLRATLLDRDLVIASVGAPGSVEIGDQDIVDLAGIATDDDAPTAGTESAAPIVDPDAPAYVIFTSGSTGEPKGIVHSHRSGLAYARLAVATHGLTAADRIAGMPPLHFDMSTLELYAAPLAGAASVPIGDAELRVPATFAERSEAVGLSVWYAVPFQLRQVVSRGAVDRRDLSSLRHVIYAGEAYPAGALAELMTAFPGARVTNAYGPAETNVCTVHELDGPPDGEGAVPIGRPWGDVEVRVVDADGDDVSGAGEGELLVVAETTMLGYLGRDDLTAAAFDESADDDRRWYRTGDLVRRDDDGLLHLRGRRDHQVKIRGVRIELEAVEAIVAAAEGVVDAVVAPDRSDDGADRLVAAVTAATEVDERALRQWCAARLPAVAVPVSFRIDDHFPRTSSDKIDRAAVRSTLRASETSTAGVSG